MSNKISKEDFKGKKCPKCDGPDGLGNSGDTLWGGAGVGFKI